jgi:hypothetical protein
VTSFSEHFKNNKLFYLGLFFHYEGQYIITHEEKAIWQESWFWILLGIVILSLFVIVVLGCYCYHHTMR